MSEGEGQALPGMADLCAPEIFLWQRIEDTARDVLAQYGFTEVRTPLLERSSLFRRAIGETTDVVQKEMYVLHDRGGREMALRPEGTAGVLRFVAAGGPERAEARLYYLGPMFRAERPQAGRRRQFHQIGVEAMGPPVPAADAECLALQVHLLQAVGLDGFSLRLNTRGQPSDAPAIRAGIRAGLAGLVATLCEDCRRRLESSPMRILDCKRPECRAAAERLPPITSFMGEDSRRYFDEVRRLLDRLELPAQPDPRLIRGLDYYVHTIWEITHPALGAQDAVAGGGRYRLRMAGRDWEGVGFAVGLERLVLALRALGAKPEELADRPRVWLIAADLAQTEDLLVLLQTLRRRGVASGMDFSGRSVKAQMRAANRSGAGWAILRGNAEAAKGVYLLKDMATGEQEEVVLADLLRRFTES